MPDGTVVGIGAANVDVHVHSRAPLVLRDSNPGTSVFSAGGVTRNILENLSRLGVSTELVSALGEDLFADYLLVQCGRLNIGTRFVRRFNGEKTSSYTAIMDSDGDMFAAVSDMSVLQKLLPDELSGCDVLLSSASLIVCDPCLPEETVSWLCDKYASLVPLACDPVSTAYAARLRPYRGSFSLLKPNRMELEILAGISADSRADIQRAADLLLTEGTERVMVSLGAEGCYYADREDNCFFAALSADNSMVDATGAGDAFLAGAIYAILKKEPPCSVAGYALAAGKIAVRSRGACSGELSESLLDSVRMMK